MVLQSHLLASPPPIAATYPSPAMWWHPLFSSAPLIYCGPPLPSHLCLPSLLHRHAITKVSLKKPILVLMKLKLRNEKEEDVDGDDEGDEKSRRVELDVIGIIRHKILFKTRPKALISTKGAQLSVKEKVSAPSSTTPH